MESKRALAREDFVLVDVSGVDSFDVEAEYGGWRPLGFSCDEADGPIVVGFGSEKGHVLIGLAALRTLLNDAESFLQKRREDWTDPLAPDS